MEQTLQFRLYEEGDLPGLLRLWEEESGWGSLTAEQWRQWYERTPHGPCLVSVAVDAQGGIAGQEVFTPARVVVGAREVRALRLSAPILRRDLRRARIRSMSHPVIGLYQAGAEAAVAQGYQLVYALPEHAWLPFFRWLPRFADAEYGCVAAAPAAGDLADRSLRTSPVAHFGEDYAALWQDARETFPIHCGVERSPNWLRYKNGGHLALEVRDGSGALVGYTTIRKQDGLIQDVLARRPADLTQVLAQTLAWLWEPGNAASITVLKAMQTPALQPSLQALGFATLDYQFGFVCDALDPALGAEAIAPALWYITPGD